MNHAVHLVFECLSREYYYNTMEIILTDFIHNTNKLWNL